MTLRPIDAILTDMLAVNKVQVAGQDRLYAMIEASGPQSGGLPPRPRVQLKCTEVTRTQQSFRDECDINRIMAKHRKTGELTHLAQRDPQYGDFSAGLDYQEASNRVLAAQADFDSLSANIRQRMQNSPQVLLDFMADPNNLEEARELGLLNPAPQMPEGTSDEGAAASGGETPPLESGGNTPIAGGD